MSVRWGTLPAMTDECAGAASAALEPGEAAIVLGVTEDDVLIRQHRGELPPVLRFDELRPDAVDAPPGTSAGGVEGPGPDERDTPAGVPEPRVAAAGPETSAGAPGGGLGPDRAGADAIGRDQ